MKIVITESQFQNLILEANKRDILVNKIGFSPLDAQTLENIAGGLCIWLGKKLYQHIFNLLKKDDYETDTHIQTYITNNSIVSHQYRPYLTSIMDWFRVGLNGNIKPYENLSFNELYVKSKEWHDQLKENGGSINYDEKNEIVRDYRENGLGYYWANLNTNDSNEECNRMGHCGRTDSDNTLYSLRKTEKFNDKYTINKSVLTSAIGKNNGIIYQMKGPKNSKPKEELHPYILDLLINDESIKGFGSEYESSLDFKVTDLPQDDILNLYKQRPELFNALSSQKILYDLGLINSFKVPELEHFLEIYDPSHLRYYIEGDYTVGSYRKKDGTKQEITFFQKVMSGEYWELYDVYDDWESMCYIIDEDNFLQILNYLGQWMEEGEKENYLELIKDPKTNREKILIEIIKTYDHDYNVKGAIGSAHTDLASLAYGEYSREKIKEALSEYGEVIKFESEEITVRIDLWEYLGQLGYGYDEKIDLYSECEEVPSCIFDKTFDDYGTKPEVNINENRIPDIDSDEFNYMLNDRLGDIR